MEKKFTLFHTFATATAFSAMTGWYGFMIGRETIRMKFGPEIDEYRRRNPDPNPPPPHA